MSVSGTDYYQLFLKLPPQDLTKINILGPIQREKFSIPKFNTMF